MIKKFKSKIKGSYKYKILSSLATFLIVHSYCFAASTTSSRFPWRTMLTSLKEEFTGFIPITLGAIGIAFTGLMMMFGYGGELMKTGFKIVIGVTIAIAGVSLIDLLAGDAGGLVFK